MTSLAKYQKALTILFDPAESSVRLLAPPVVDEAKRTIRATIRSAGVRRPRGRPPRRGRGDAAAAFVSRTDRRDAAAAAFVSWTGRRDAAAAARIVRGRRSGPRRGSSTSFAQVLKLPWRPRIAPWESYLVWRVDSDGLIFEQAQTWNVSSADALRQTFAVKF